MSEHEIQMRDATEATGRPKPIAAFDFDGTLTIRDSFRAFLRWKAGPIRYLAAYVRLAPAALAYLSNRDRGALKAAMVRIHLGGASRAELAKLAEAFAEAAIAGLMRPDALETWNRHKSEGVVTVIVTASPDILVAPFARRLGADSLFGTRLAFDTDDRVVGVLDGPNCRGPEKVRRLREAFGDDVALLAAYGDSAGDIEMLKMAQTPGMKVFTGRP